MSSFLGHLIQGLSLERGVVQPVARQVFEAAPEPEIETRQREPAGVADGELDVEVPVRATKRRDYLGDRAPAREEFRQPEPRPDGRSEHSGSQDSAPAGIIEPREPIALLPHPVPRTPASIDTTAAATVAPAAAVSESRRVEPQRAAVLAPAIHASPASLPEISTRVGRNRFDDRIDDRSTHVQGGRPESSRQPNSPAVRPNSHASRSSITSTDAPKKERPPLIVPNTPPPPVFSPPAQVNAALPAVHVTIGRVEIRAVTAPASPTRASKAAGSNRPTMSLSDYLARRGKGA